MRRFLKQLFTENFIKKAKNETAQWRMKRAAIIVNRYITCIVTEALSLTQNRDCSYFGPSLPSEPEHPKDDDVASPLPTIDSRVVSISTQVLLRTYITLYLLESSLNTAVGKASNSPVRHYRTILLFPN